jgi:hypothetical protein
VGLEKLLPTPGIAECSKSGNVRQREPSRPQVMG